MTRIRRGAGMYKPFFMQPFDWKATQADGTPTGRGSPTESTTRELTLANLPDMQAIDRAILNPSQAEAVGPLGMFRHEQREH